MKGKQLQLIFRGTNAYLCRDKAFSLHELGLSNMISFFKYPAYWTLKVIETFPIQRRIHVEILSYNSGNIEISDFQQEQQSELSKYTSLTFKSVDTMRAYSSTKNSENNKPFERESTNFIRGERHNPQKISEPIITTDNDDFWVDFNDIRFMLGYITFTTYIKKLNQSIEFKIYNDNILPEFDNIKFWFSKRLKTKRIRVKAVFKLTNYKPTEWSATSNEIDCINSELIEGVKVQRTLEFAKSIKTKDVNKALFTNDDPISLDGENDLFGNVFKETESEILDTLLENSNVRNKKELMYLSGKIHSVNCRIRFSNHPIFGFVFLCEGESNNHFIWELLNTNATYVWTIDKDFSSIELQYKRIEKTISSILNSSRETYIRAYKNHQIDSDLIFNRIFHNDKDSDFIDSFPRWKQKVNDLLT